MKKIFYLILITFLLSFVTLEVNASKVYYINDTYVRMRSDFNTNSDKILTFPKEAVITLLSLEKKLGYGCETGWYNVSYDGKNGYVCSLYVSEKTSTSTVTYNRPWTTPKKSIVGGAEFIFVNFLDDGQYNSYLKKFNVNPNSPAPFNNQYMTNITAPSSEAVTSFNSYKESNLLDKPLIFEIPIFNGMPANTYSSSIRELTIQEELAYDANDADLVAFESLLDKEGFDETYKLKLRALHKKYPNWQFKSLNTGFDFTYAAQRQQTVGALPNGWKQCSLEEDSVEPGWCTPTYEATAMYMDPRNFLSERYILQFESLFYNEIFTESVVQTVLDGTAMSGISLLDSQSFSSIFVEAGSTYNVSPVYLASLARQETGNGTGFSARGESFTYNGIFYEGNLYNYFNIGASSGDNPVLKGLVFASAGLTFGSANNSNSSNVETVVATSEETYIQMLGILKDSGYLKGYSFGTTVNSIKSTVNGRANVVVANASGNVVSDSEKIGTGSQLTISDGTSEYTYTVVIKGDITGDGEINSADLLKVRQFLIGTANLGDSYKDSADINKDGTINSADLLMVRQQLLGTYNIVQG